MKTVFEQETRNELIRRIQSLQENSPRQWGKMSLSQMLRHCTQFEEMSLGKKKYKQAFLGKLFGKLALKNILRDKPLKKNLPTVPEFRIKEKEPYVEEGKKNWISLIGEYELLSTEGFVHPFFGRMTKDQSGYWSYKHADHHLRQFSA
jgi:hypothetical protein